VPSRSPHVLTFIFGLVFVFLVTNAVISYRSVDTINDNLELLLVAQRFQAKLDQTYISIIAAEASQRGYVISLDPYYLQNYGERRQQIGERLEGLKSLVASDDPKIELINDLEAKIADRMALADKVIEVRQQGGIPAVVNSGLFEQGRVKMLAVRDAVGAIQAVETDLFNARAEESRRSTVSTRNTFILVNLLVIAVSILAFYFNRRYLREHRESEEKLTEANEMLETRVEERTLALGDANKELERSNRELQDFAYVASHDLQEPLRKIQAFGGRLDSKFGGDLGDEGRDYLDRMLNSAQRMHVLINDLLTFSRVTTQAKPFVPTDLAKVADEVIGDLEIALQTNNGKIEVSDLPVIEADALQMRQLLQNLLGNALKFHRSDVPPVIQLTGTIEPAPNSESADVCVLRVADNGIGFDEKYLDRIFTPFQRLHGRGVYDGTGIGLAVCRKITERHGGTLTAESTPGVGSTFIARLPVRQIENKGDLNEETGSTDRNTNGGR
jgi:signal transduction histidine kinase